MTPQELQSLLAAHPWKELPRSTPKDPTYLLSCPVRLRWLALAEPRKPKSDKPNTKALYSVTCLVPPQADVTVVRNAYHRLMVDRFGPDYAKTLVKTAVGADGNPIVVSAITGGFKRQAIQAAKGTAGFSQDGFWFDAASERQPPLVGRDKRPIDPKSVYKGQWALVHVKMYARPKQGTDNPGCSFQLEAVQVIGDDERFEDRNAAAVFDDLGPHTGGAPAGAGPAQPPTELAGF